jgi:1-acyl-sn-glycerol-3-phosphate acyltransferase
MEAGELCNWQTHGHENGLNGLSRDFASAIAMGISIQLEKLEKRSPNLNLM